MIIEVFPYIILFNFCPNAKSAKLNSTPNFVDLQYINDRLTQHRQHLLYAARKLVKSKKLFVAWAQRGNILIRKREDSRIIEVKDHADLREFTTSQEDEEYQEKSDSSINDNSVMSHLSDYEYYVDSDV